MKILFYDTKSYDREFFEKLLPSYPGIEIKFIEANIHEETAALAHGYDAICAFVNADLGAPVIEELHRQGVKLILMRCAGYNNVDLETTAKCGIQVARVPGYSPEAVEMCIRDRSCTLVAIAAETSATEKVSPSK